MSPNNPLFFENKLALNNYYNSQKLANQLLENTVLEENVCQDRLRHSKIHASSCWEESSPWGRNGRWGLLIRTKLKLGALSLLVSTFLVNSKTMLLFS